MSYSCIKNTVRFKNADRFYFGYIPFLWAKAWIYSFFSKPPFSQGSILPFVAEKIACFLIFCLKSSPGYTFIPQKRKFPFAKFLQICQFLLLKNDICRCRSPLFMIDAKGKGINNNTNTQPLKYSRIKKITQNQEY